MSYLDNLWSKYRSKRARDFALTILGWALFWFLVGYLTRWIHC